MSKKSDAETWTGEMDSGRPFVSADPAYPSSEAPPTATCPFCDEVVALVFEANRRLLVADHLDVYPTRVCEGSGRIALVVNGRIYIAKAEGTTP